MDKNTLLGLVMMACVVFGFMWLNKPSEEQLAAQRAEQEQMAEQARIQAEEAARIASQPDSVSAAERTSLITTIKQVGTTDSVNGTVSFADANVNITIDGQNISGQVKAAGSSIDINDLLANNFSNLTLAQSKAAVANLRSALENAGRYSTFARYLSGSDETIKLANDLLAVEFSTLGGRPSRATLLDYDNFLNNDTTNVVMFTPETSTLNFKLVTSQQQRLDTDKFYFTPVVESDSTVLMKLDLGNGAMWGIRYTLRSGSYLLGMEVVQKNMESIISPSTATIDFDFGVKMARNEAGRTFEEQKSAIYYKYVGDSPDDLNYASDKIEELKQPVKWIAFKDQFFSTAFIPRSSFATAEVNQQVLKNDPMFLKQMNASTVLEYNPSVENPVAFDIFIGPNLYPLLASLDDTLDTKEGLQLTRLIPLGWPIIRWINTLVIIPVFTFLNGFISNYGIIILILTLFIKLILFPLTYKSFMSQAKMRVLAPDIKAINEKYPGTENAMTRNSKTMELYSRAGANPMSGCLPMLLQMPILIAMFWFFPSCIELRGESFLWAHNLAAPDVIFTLPFTIPWYGNHVSLFCLMMTVVNIIYTRINMQNQAGGEQMAMMKWMMYLMPVMFLFIFNDYAAGLSYYYFLSLLITIIQTYIFRRFVDEKKVRAKMMENSNKPRKKNGWLARLEEAQRKQLAEARAQQQKGNKRR